MDQQEYNDHLEMSRKYENYSSTKFKDDRFHLGTISFAGPVVLGVGGKESTIRIFIHRLIFSRFCYHRCLCDDTRGQR